MLDRLSRAMEEAARAMERRELDEAPRKARIRELRKTSPRVVFRDPGYYRAHYSTMRLDDLLWNRNYLNRGPAIITRSSSGSSRAMTPERLHEYARRPKAKALHRIEEAEAKLQEAKAALEAAKKAAFTYGREIPLSAVKEATRAHRRAWEGEDV